MKLVCTSCAEKYQKLGYRIAWFTYWDDCVGDCRICDGRRRLYEMRRKDELQ